MASRSLMFGGLAIAALAVLGAQVLRPDAAAVAAPAVVVAATRVLVAVRALPVGHVTAVADFDWRAWPAEGVDPAYVVAGYSIDLAGQVVRTALLPGEPVTAARLVVPGTRGPLAAVTAPGMRAAAVAPSEAAGVSGLIEPGDRVDVILTQAVGERRAATTVLRDVRVVAVDAALASTRRDEGDGGTASLELTPRQSEILALAGEMGKVSLSLRAITRCARLRAVIADIRAASSLATTVAIAFDEAEFCVRRDRLDRVGPAGRGAICAGNGGVAAGDYVIVTARYTVQPLFLGNGVGGVLPSTIVRTAMLRLQ